MMDGVRTPSQRDNMVIEVTLTKDDGEVSMLPHPVNINLTLCMTHLLTKTNNCRTDHT